MKNYIMKERTIRLNDKYDVVVVGGGPSGCTAAIAAAREGAKTMLIEATGCLGGMGTSGLVPAWCPFSDKEKIIYRGLAEKIFEEAKKEVAHVKKEDINWVPIDAERLKRVYDYMVTEAGVEVLFNTALASVDTEGNNITTVIVNNKQGLSAYSAKVFIDCTGDADLAVWAGADFHKGDEKNGELQPATHCFILSNVDEYAYRTAFPTYDEHQKIAQILAEADKYALIKDKHFCNNIVGPGTVGFNAGHQWNIDNTDPINVSKALITGRKIAAQYRDALAEVYPKAYAKSFLVSTASLIGTRESRRIVGDYVLSIEDYLDRRSFADEICRNSYYIDIHHSIKERQMEEKGEFNWQKRCSRYGAGESHGIPYRCLVPKGLKNILVAGKTISCDREVQASVRVMPVCLAMGEAAGMAAVHAIKYTDSDVHAINVEFLRNRLIEEGAYLPKIE